MVDIDEDIAGYEMWLFDNSSPQVFYCEGRFTQPKFLWTQLEFCMSKV